MTATTGGWRVRRSGPADVARCLAIWQAAVRTTHDFLSAEDFDAIERLVAEEYLPAAPLWVAVDGTNRALGFMGLTGAHIDALFVDPAAHGRGVGRALVAHAHAQHDALTVDVNEQNPRAVGFYERLGFVRIGRSAVDGDGRPYPLLHLRALTGGGAATT